MGQKFAIFILLLISLTFNLESNEMSDFLVFYFFQKKNLCDSLFSLFLTKWEYFVKFGKKEQTLIHLYKQLFGWI